MMYDGCRGVCMKDSLVEVKIRQNFQILNDYSDSIQNFKILKF